MIGLSYFVYNVEVEWSGGFFKILHCYIRLIYMRIKIFYWHYNFSNCGIKIWTHIDPCIMKSQVSVVLMVEMLVFHTFKC